MNRRDGESMARCSDFMLCFSLFLFLPCSDHTSHTPFYFFPLEHASNNCAVVCVGSVQTNLAPISNLGRLLRRAYCAFPACSSSPPPTVTQYGTQEESPHRHKLLALISRAQGVRLILSSTRPSPRRSQGAARVYLSFPNSCINDVHNVRNYLIQGRGFPTDTYALPLPPLRPPRSHGPAFEPRQADPVFPRAGW